MDDCNWDGCPRMGMYEYEGKKYCPKHYPDVLVAANKKRIAESQKPVGRAGMGAGTVVINDSAGI